RMTIAVAGQHIEQLPAQQLPDLQGRTARDPAQQGCTVTQSRPTILLVFQTARQTQRLAEVLLVQAMPPAIRAHRPVIARNDQIERLAGSADATLGSWQSRGLRQTVHVQL